MDNKAALHIIIGKGPDEIGDGQDDMNSAQVDTAKDLIKAIQSKDAQAVVDSFKMLKDLCQAEYEKQDEQDYEPNEE